MSALRRNGYLAWFAFHFILIAAVCAHETMWLLQKHTALFSIAPTVVWEKLDTVPAAILGDGLDSRNPWRRVVATYVHAAGIEAGYGYFAPNVPEPHALVFEFRYADGRVAFQRPTVRSAEAGLRLTSLIEQIGRTDYDKWRDELVTMLASAAWKQHPRAISVRAFFGSIKPPTVAEYCAGKTERTFKCLYIYDFAPGQRKGTRSTP